MFENYWISEPILHFIALQSVGLRKEKSISLEQSEALGKGSDVLELTDSIPFYKCCQEECRQ